MTIYCMWWRGGWCTSYGKHEVGGNSYCNVHYKNAVKLYSPV